MDGLWLNAGSRNFICFWPSRLSGLEETKNSKVKDLSIFAFLTLGGTFGIGIFSFLLTDFNSIELSTDN